MQPEYEHIRTCQSDYDINGTFCDARHRHLNLLLNKFFMEKLPLKINYIEFYETYDKDPTDQIQKHFLGVYIFYEKYITMDG